MDIFEQKRLLILARKYPDRAESCHRLVMETIEGGSTSSLSETSDNLGQNLLMLLVMFDAPVGAIEALVAKCPEMARGASLLDATALTMAICKKNSDAVRMLAESSDWDWKSSDGVGPCDMVSTPLEQSLMEHGIISSAGGFREKKTAVMTVRSI